MTGIEKKETLHEILRGFSGTEAYYRLTYFGKFVCTEGVKAFAEMGKAFWALDLIASYQSMRSVAKEGFQCWTIESKEGKFYAKCSDGNSKELAQQEGATDLEEGKYRFFLTGNVLMLDSEY